MVMVIIHLLVIGDMQLLRIAFIRSSLQCHDKHRKYGGAGNRLLPNGYQFLPNGEALNIYLPVVIVPSAGMTS